MIRRWIFLRDGRLSLRDRAVLALLFLAALVLLVPLRLVLAGVPALSARSVEGPAWAGTAFDFKAGPVPLGTVDVGLMPLSLLTGQTEVWLARRTDKGATPFTARVAGGADWLRLRAVEGSLAVGDGLGTLPVTSAGFGSFDLAMDGGRCTAASGRVTLTLAPLSVLMPGPLVLSGEARCQGGALVIPMQGAGGMERLLLKITGDGAWNADLSLKGLPVEVATPLQTMGFAARPEGALGIRTGGRF